MEGKITCVNGKEFSSKGLRRANLRKRNGNAKRRSIWMDNVVINAASLTQSITEAVQQEEGGMWKTGCNCKNHILLLSSMVKQSSEFWR